MFDTMRNSRLVMGYCLMTSAVRMSRSLRRFISSNFTDGQRALDDAGVPSSPQESPGVSGGTQESLCSHEDDECI